MEFDLSEDQIMLKRAVRDFLEKEIAPIVDERDRGEPFTKEELVTYVKKLMPFGYYTGNLPEEYGGMNLSLMTMSLLQEELFRVWGSLGLAVSSMCISISDMLNTHEEVRKKYLPRLATVELIPAGAITEPNVGSDAANVETTAVLDGDEYVINGTKIWITNGSVADIVRVLAVTDKSQGRRGLSRIVVDKEESPFTARHLHHMGWHCAPTGELSFVDCRVPKENLLIYSTTAYQGTMKVLDWARALMAIAAIGVAQAAIDASIKYAQERVQFGRPIGSFQLVQEMIFDMMAETDAARLLTYRAIHKIEKGERARLELSLAKGYACEAATRVTSKAIEIHGAMGLSDEYPVERYYRDAKMTTIPDGTYEIQKLIVGREAIGIRAFD